MERCGLGALTAKSDRNAGQIGVGTRSGTASDGSERCRGDAREENRRKGYES